MRLSLILVIILVAFSCRNETPLDRTADQPNTQAPLETAPAPVTEKGFSVQVHKDTVKPGKPGEIIISIAINKHNWKTGEDENSIIPIARYADGIYDVIEEVTYFDDSIPLDKSTVKPFLDMYKTYTLWWNGKPVGKTTIEKVQTEQMECMGMVDGYSRKTELEKQWIWKELEKQGTTKESIARDSNCTWIYMVGTAGLKKETQVKKFDNSLIKSTQKNLRKMVTESIFKESGYIADPDSIKLESQNAYDIDGDGRPENFVACYYEDTIHLFSYLYGYRITEKQSVDTFFTSGGEMETDSWGIGPSLLNVLDINGDGVPELIFRYDGYESTEFLIYEYRDGKLKQVFDGGGWGC